LSFYCAKQRLESKAEFTIIYNARNNRSLNTIVAAVNAGFVGPEAYSVLGAFLKKKNTKLITKVNICLGLIPGPWKGPVQLRGPEA